MNIIKKYSLWIVIALTLVACVYAYFQFLLPLDVFLWDESHHGFFGMQIYNDLKAGDWGLFWTHTNNQALWMPLHSWLDGIFLVIFGFSYASARLSSLFLFFVCSILMYFIGVELSKEKGRMIGLIASVLFLTSPMMLHLATVNMQEMLGIFVLLLLVYFILKYWVVEAVWKYLIIGFLISVAYLTKSNFALQLILGIGLFQLSLLWGFNASPLPPPEPAKKKKHNKQQPKPAPNKFLGWTISNIYIIAGFLPLFILWWATPPFDRKYGLGFIFRTQGIGEAIFYPSVNFFGRVIFYLQSLIASYTFSLWLGIGLLTALGLAIYWFEDKKLRLMLILFLANLFMISLVGNIQERYISTAAPLTFVLFAYFLVIYAERLRGLNRTRSLTIGLGVLMAVLICADALSLPRYTKEAANRSIMFPIYKDSLNKFDPPFMFGLLKRPAFTYSMEQVKKLPSFKQAPRSSLNEIMSFFSSNIEKNRSIATFISYHELSPYVVYWHFQGWQAPVFTGNDAPIIGKYFWMTDYFLGLQPAPDSPYAVEQLDMGWDQIGPKLLKGGYIRLVASKEFADLGLTANIYKREKDI